MQPVGVSPGNWVELYRRCTLMRRTSRSVGRALKAKLIVAAVFRSGCEALSASLPVMLLPPHRFCGQTSCKNLVSERWRSRECPTDEASVVDRETAIDPKISTASRRSSRPENLSSRLSPASSPTMAPEIASADLQGRGLEPRKPQAAGTAACW